MALKAAKNVRIYIEGYDISGRSNSLRPSLARDFEDVTCFSNNGHKWFPTLTKDGFSFNGFYDSANITEIMNTLRGSSSGVVCLLLGPNLSDKAVCGGGAWQEGYDIEMPVAGMLTLAGVFQFDGIAEDCIVLQASATKASNGNGTAVNKIDNVHKVQDTANEVTSDDADSQGTLETLLNEIRGDYNTHRVSTTYHDAADSTNDVDAAEASDLDTAKTLANQIKAKFNAHRSQSGVHPHDDGDNEVTSPDATDLPTCETLANEIKGDFNDHLLDVTDDGAVGYLQVFACGADDALIVKVQDSDDSVFTSPHDLITFATANGVTAERKIATGDVKRYVRVNWAGTPTYSATFAICFKRN